MQVDEGERARAAQEPVGEIEQGAARPGRLGAAEEQSAGIAMLAARDRGLKREIAVLLGIGLQRLLARRPRIRGPFRRVERRGDLVVARVQRQRRREIDEVAVQVDIVLGHAPGPGEAVRIDRVDDQRADAGGQPRRTAAGDPAGLAARAAMPLDPVRRGNKKQRARRIIRPEPGGVDAEVAAVRPLAGVRHGVQRAPGGAH